MKYEEGLKILRYNEKTGKWYKDKPTEKNPWQMTVYLLSDKPCEICGEKFFYCSGNKGNCCSLKCNTLKRNKIHGISEETAKKIGDENRGKKRTLEDRKKQSIRQKIEGRWKNEKNPAWKGGIDREIKYGIYTSVEYKNWRLAVFKRDNYICALCGNRGCKLEAHHIKKRSVFDKGLFDEDNGITLCKSCHQGKVNHHEEKFEEKFITFIEQKEPH